MSRPVRPSLVRGRCAAGGKLLVLLAVGFITKAGQGAELDDAQRMFLTGDYQECREKAQAAIQNGAYGESWPLLLAEVELLTGRYAEARETLESALKTYSWSVKLRCRLREALRFTGDADRVEALEAEISRLVEASPWRYTDAENLVLLGHLALDMGADAKQVQESFFQRARRNNAVHRLPRLALGRLALEKRDFQLAADTFREAIEKHPDDPDLLFGLAEAVEGSDPERAQQLLERVAGINPRYIPLLLKGADRLITAEAYDEAELELNKVLEVNDRHPAALAYWAVLAHLRNDVELEQSLRSDALAAWSGNPEVDHIIGRELSQKYRFAEGAAAQQRALELDPEYAPARKQLATDLLRLGREIEGWKLAEEAHTADPYDVNMYNLVTLRDALDRFATLEAEGLVVRMDRREAAVYGERVLEVLTEARDHLTAKYHVELTQPVLVEIFPQPADFAVRTFGMPGVAGYLGVCFGNVVTANSPASQDLNPANWESVLWHEFTHVVTLNLTHNRMPRWLSEGISVYEERQRDPTWGEQLTPTYRQFMLGEDLTPVSQLSGAFIKPKSARHVAFAYFQSSLVVEYLIDRFGFEALLAILRDLGAGVTINEALERHTEGLAELDDDFARHARELARQFRPDVDWSTPMLDAAAGETAEERLQNFVRDNPNNYPALELYADLLLKQDQSARAEPVLRKLVQMHPTATGADSPPVLLAQLLRRTGRGDEERALLAQIIAIDDTPVGSLLRMLEIDRQREDWEGLLDHAGRLRAVNPLTPHPHRALADAAERLDRPAEALLALRSLLAVTDDDPAGTHYRLARLLAAQGEHAPARRHVLAALEEAPRYRDALRLLLELPATAVGSDGVPPASAPAATPPGAAPRANF